MSRYLGIIFSETCQKLNLEISKLIKMEVHVNNFQELTLAAGAAGFLAACLAFLASLAALNERERKNNMIFIILLSILSYVQELLIRS